ncbi:hypothetical protein EKN07_11755 [Actinobaculum sp. 352]|nr:hypothetical protein EKN07_11755 [Actinobaculum sp. 352]
MGVVFGCLIVCLVFVFCLVAGCLLLWWVVGCCFCWVGFGSLFVFCGEFDPGSGRTLAACLTHASRTGSFWLFGWGGLVANG